MLKKLNGQGWFWALVIIGWLLTCCVGPPNGLSGAPTPQGVQGALALPEEPAAPPAPMDPEETEGSGRSEGQQQWARAVAAATAAANLAQQAVTAADWDQVAIAWTEALNAVQAIPAESPQRVFAQRKAREYLQNLKIAQQQAEKRGAPKIFPTLGTPILDEQLGLYLSYVATVGPPDVLIIGSSRALQGVDPQTLQQTLANRGYPGVQVFNFGVNGATAQVMSFVLRQVLTPEQLPRLVVWADGSRAFNSARFDRTFASILTSPGYQTLRSGTLPALAGPEDTAPPANAIALPISPITAQGFLPVADRFDPARYYQQFPRVSGRYDDAYNPFRLEGVQTVSLQAIATFLNSRQIPLVLVNLPLSEDYLDAVRSSYEQRFQQYLQQQAKANGFILIDWLAQWRNQPGLFADPSHLNHFGAMELARQLAVSDAIPWAILQPSEDK